MTLLFFFYVCCGGVLGTVGESARKLGRELELQETDLSLGNLLLTVSVRVALLPSWFSSVIVGCVHLSIVMVASFLVALFAS